MGPGLPRGPWFQLVLWFVLLKWKISCCLIRSCQVSNAWYTVSGIVEPDSSWYYIMVVLWTISNCLWPDSIISPDMLWCSDWGFSDTAVIWSLRIILHIRTASGHHCKSSKAPTVFSVYKQFAVAYKIRFKVCLLLGSNPIWVAKNDIQLCIH